MSTSVRLIFYFFWITPHLLQSIIVVVLARNRLYRSFPAFTAYTIFEICNFIASFVVNGWALKFPAYLEFYAFGLAVSSALRFGIVYEVFARLFRKYETLHYLEKPLFSWSMIALLILAFFLATYTHRNDVDPTWFTVHVLDRSVSIIQCGLVLSLLVFAAVMNIRWTRHLLGIILGLGILSSVEIAVAAIRSQIGLSAHVALDLITMGTYFGCVILWLYCLQAPEKSSGHPPDILPEHDLEAWNQEMQHLLQRQ